MAISVARGLGFQLPQKSDMPHLSTSIADFADWARGEGVTVLASWPDTTAFAAYEAEPGFAEIEAFHAGLGAPMAGSPDIAGRPADAFCDIPWRLRPPAIEARAARCVEAMTSMESAPAGAEAGRS